MTPANKRFYLVLGIIGVLLLGWWAWNQFSPKPLGDKLEYVGRSDYGSWLPLSSAPPTAVYYYATDMSNESLVNYFRNATSSSSDGSALNTDYKDQYIKLKNKHSGKEFLVVYYSDGAATARQNKLSPITKSHVVTVDSFNYDIAKASL